MKDLLRALFCTLTVLGCVPPGEYHCAHGEAVTFDPGVPELDLCPNVNRIHAAGARVCHRAGGDISRIGIFVKGKDFECGTNSVHGCSAWPNRVYVRDASVLPDEIGHLVWFSCFNRSGEIVESDGIHYDPDFQEFVNSLQ